ncbi:zinc-binding dehydrogenase [bacterium]|nr:zinc-binding dehydrogenase [bacterium]
MRCVVVREHGPGTDVLRFEERPVPEPGPGEARIRVAACAMNHLDTWVRRGVPGHTFPLPIVPGCDIAGTVDALGAGVANARVGDRVAVAPGVSCGACRACLSGSDHLCRSYGILGEHRDGGYAEAVIVPARNLIPIADSMTFPEAASISLVFLTAWHMLVLRSELRPGEDVLVHAAGSGIGTAAIQIAKLWGARRIIASASTKAKLDRARELGATHLVNYTETDLSAEVKKITGKQGVDVVLEHTGAATWESSMRSVKWAGRIVLCGATSGPDVKLDLRPVFFKSLSILGSTMGSQGELREIWEHVRAGALKPVVDVVWPLERVRDAHERMAKREQIGKIVLTPAP